MNTIVVVGCGNIGSRLIQSLSNINSEEHGHFNIVGLEPFPTAWPVVQTRFDEENKGGHTLSMIAKSEDLPKEASLMVFAMDARNRLGAMRDALAVCRPVNVLLEKILFTETQEYDAARALIEGVGAKCWVNTSRNVWPGYQALKETLAGAEITGFTVSGSDWGLGCNAIHFLSAFEFISGDTITGLKLDMDTAVINASKRAGYQELTGTLMGASAQGANVSVSSLAEAGHPISVIVDTNLGQFTIAEGRSIVNGNTPAESTSFGLLYTSQLHAMFEEILAHGQSGLPNLAQSTSLHRHLLSALNEIFHGEASLAYACPIT